MVVARIPVRMLGLRIAGQETHRRRDEEAVVGWDSCPLYDAEWAAGSGATPRVGFPFDPTSGAWLEVPDHLPDEWEDG